MYMPKRTTVLLDKKIYKELVDESITKYGDAKHISKVINDRLSSHQSSVMKIVKLANSKKFGKVSQSDFEEFRSKLSERLES